METGKLDKTEETEKKTEQQDKNDEEVVSIELPAPEGWIKKFLPKKGRTPRRNEIIFISPTGEEIKNKRQLDQYLKSHSGGPSSSDFDWGTGDTPRRSARISEKSKASEAPENESSQERKRKRKSRSEEAAKEKKVGTDEEGGHDSAREGTDGDREVEMKDAEEPSGTDKAEEATGVAHVVKNPNETTEEKVDEMGSENPEREEAVGNKPEGAQAGDENLPDVKEEIRGEKKNDDENKQVEEQKKAGNPLAQASASTSAETPSIVGEAAAKENPSADVVAEPEKEPESSILGPESSQRKEGAEEVASRKEIGTLVDKENEADAPSADAVAKSVKASENSKLDIERSEKKEDHELSHSEEGGAPVHKKNEETATQSKNPSASSKESPHVPLTPPASH